MSPTGQYTLQSNHQAAQRLELQHSAYAKASQQLLLDAGLTKGMNVLEVGCGPGSMTEWLAQQVGEKGKLIAIDIAPSYIEQTKKRLQGQPQCEVMLHDVHDLKSLDQKFDLIYYRMVLHHLPDPENVLTGTIVCLNKNGILVCEEPPSVEGVFCYPQSAALLKQGQWIFELLTKNNSAYQFPYKMYSFLEKANLKIKIQQIFQPLLNKEQRKLKTMGLREISPKLIEYGIATQEEIDALYSQVEKEMIDAQLVSHLRMFQVAAVKQSNE